jgi:CSLREA domain-containing protein
MSHSVLLRTLTGSLLFVSVATTHAATLQVTTTMDQYDGVCDQHCSLRDAVTAANQAPELDSILLAAGTYVLTSPALLDTEPEPLEETDNSWGDLDISGTVKIIGVDAERSIIQGQANGRLLQVHPGARVRLEKLTLKGGHAYQDGGAVKNEGELVLHQVNVLDNRAQSDEGMGHRAGGAIANYGTLGIFASHFSGNSVSSTSGDGGALFNQGEVLVRDSSFVGNSLRIWLDGRGAALHNTGTASIERSAFVSNSSIHDFGDGSAVFNENMLTLVNSTFSRNEGSAVFNYVDAQMSVANVTIADTIGTGLDNMGKMQVRDSVVVGTKLLWGFIGGDCWNSSFPAEDLQTRGLLLSDPNSNCGADFVVPAEQVETTLLLPLASEGHNAFYPLRPGSIAVDAGAGSCPKLDQRSVARPQDGNGDGVAVCDLGAFEVTAK